MTPFLWLLFAHLLADYPLQGEFLATTKGNNPIALISHAAIWTGTITLAMTLLGYAPSVLVVASLFAVHTIADLLKARRMLWYKRMNPLSVGLLVDQLIHAAQIVVAMWMVGGIG